MKKIITLMLVVMMLTVSFAACGKKDKGTTPTDNGNTQNTDAGKEVVERDIFSEPDSPANTFTLGCQEASGTFSPVYYSSSYDGYIVDLIFEGLTSRNKDGEIVGQIAKSWDVSEDKRTFTFHMDPNAKFSDGTPVTAKDVEFTYKILGHPDYDGRYGSVVQDIEGAEEFAAGTADTISGIKVVNDNTISFTFKEALRVNIENSVLGILPMHYYSDNGAINFEKIKSLNEKPMGAGPYEMKEYVPQQFASLTRTKNYAGEGYQIKNVVIKFLTQVTEIDELTTGGVDMLAGQIDPLNVQAAKDAGNINLVQYPRSGYGFLRYNCTSPITGDVRVRQALAYAFDKEKFVEDMYGDLAVTQPSPMSQVSWAYTEELKSKLDPYAYNVEKANQLLDEAGWKMGSDGIREKDGKKLVVNIPAMPEHSVLDVLVPTLKEQYKAVGAELNATYLDFNSLLEKIYGTTNDWELFFLATSIPTADPDSLYSEWHSKYIGSGMDNNSRFADAKNDELLDKGRAEFDIEKAKKIYEDWAINFNEKLALNVVYANVYTDMINNRIEGIETTSLYKWTSALKDATIKQ